MAQWNLSDGHANSELVRDAVHQLFGKPAGLFRDEYNIVIDTDITDNLRIGEGTVVQIMIRYLPNDPRFQPILKHIFNNYPLKSMLRSKALIRRSDAEKWYGASESGYFKKVDKKVGLDTCVVRYITKLEVVDKKTKRSVTVEIQGDAFKAREIAIKLLYPESDNEEYKDAIRRARRIKKSDD